MGVFIGLQRDFVAPVLIPIDQNSFNTFDHYVFFNSSDKGNMPFA